LEATLTPSLVSELNVEKLLDMAEAFRTVGGYRAERVLRWARCYAKKK
jgi:hypothetical protein